MFSEKEMNMLSEKEIKDMLFGKEIKISSARIKKENVKLENKDMIEIQLTNGDVIHYKQEDYTDYKYDGKCFIVIKEMQWIGIYNLDHIVSVEIYDEDEKD